MAEHRPFPPSERRRAAARQAGLHAASPFLVGAAAAAAAVLTAGAIAGAARQRLAGALAAALEGAADPAAGALTGASGATDPGVDALAGASSAVTGVVAAIALPIAGAAALAAVVAHLVQTRAPWLPRRRIPGAPAVATGPLPRTRRAAFELTAGVAAGAVAFGWLWFAAPHLAALTRAARPPSLATAAALLTSFAAALLVAWAVLGVLDALVRRAALTGALAMTAAEHREDTRLAGADPRWRARRAAAARGPAPAAAIAGASLVLAGDAAAVAIAWDPLRRPVPTRVASATGARAGQLLALARRHRVPVHRDPPLAAALSAGDGDGPVPAAHWPRLAEVVAATRGRRDRPPPHDPL